MKYTMQLNISSTLAAILLFAGCSSTGEKCDTENANVMSSWEDLLAAKDYAGITCKNFELFNRCADVDKHIGNWEFNYALTLENTDHKKADYKASSYYYARAIKDAYKTSDGKTLSAAANNLALNFLHGNGVVQNTKIAENLLKQALKSNKNDSTVLYNYGIKLTNGTFLPEQENLGYKMINKAALLGKTDAQIMLAKTYKDGTKLTTDRSKSYLMASIYEQCAENDEIEPQILSADYAVGLTRTEKKTVTRNVKKITADSTFLCTYGEYQTDMIYSPRDLNEDAHDEPANDESVIDEGNITIE